jgi:hypothetical protein
VGVDPALQRGDGRVVLQARDVIETGVVELIVEGTEEAFEGRLVHDPAKFRVEPAFGQDLHFVAVAVEALLFLVALRVAVGRFHIGDFR